MDGLREQARQLALQLLASHFAGLDIWRNILIQAVLEPLSGLVLLWGLGWLWPGRRLPAAVILLASLVVATGAGLTGWPAIILATLLLGLYAFAACRPAGAPLASTLAAVAFAAYLAYWAAAKYLLPLAAGLRPELAAEAGRLRPFVVIGVSYIGFKLIHFFVDKASGELQDARPLEVLAWLLFFPAIIAGPMQRFQDWQHQRAVKRAPDLEDIAEGIRRLVIGLTLKFVLADTIYGATLAGMSRGALAAAGPGRLALAAGLYSLYLYWDFSGYSHMAIGVARFWGIRLPENFRWPFMARNLADFWNRWHMTLSHILRDYLFYPLSLNLKRRPFFRRHPALGIALPPIVTFAIAGIWHGAGLDFLIYGLLHGVGLAVVALLGRSPARSPLATWWKTSRAGYALSAALTFSYVSFTFVFFVLPFDSLLLAIRGR